MIKRLSLLLLFACSTAHAQFVTGQILTAQQLNNAFANVLTLTGGTLAGPLTVPTMTVTGNLTVNGTFTLAGGLSPSSLAPQAANTVLANATAASASPTAVALPSCSTANSALKYTSATGFLCGTTYALTTGTLAQFAATTSAQLLGVISDETGSGSLVFGTSPTISGATISGGTISSSPISGSTGSFTTLAASGAVSGTGFTNLFASTPAIGGTAANTGAFTTLSASGLITPASTVGIKGTATNDSVQAGSVGEFVCAQVTNGGSPAGCAANTSTPVSLTTVTTANITSISLTAGDWDVWGNVGFLPGGTTVTASQGCWISTSSATTATSPNLGSYTFQNGLSSTAGANTNTYSCGTQRLTLASTTTVFIEAFSSFSTSTETAFGFIGARRRR